MDTPRGVATSEFWIAVSPWILALVVLLGLIFDAVDPDTSLALIGLLGIGGSISSVGYSNSRAKVKVNG
jgi:hypothetical protein